MSKKIALYADAFNNRVGSAETYVEYFSKFGEVLLVTAMNDLPWFIQHCDILAMPGGPDIDPRRYGASPWFAATRVNPYYEHLDEFLLKPWLQTGKPVIGICRGMQSLNVVLGGTLWPHLNGHNLHWHDRDETPQELYTDIDGFHIVPINSFHHQGVKELGAGMDMIGWTGIDSGDWALKYNHNFSHIYTETGSKKNKKHYRIHGGQLIKTVELFHVLPEVIKHQTRPWIGFQYHPEEYDCPFATTMIHEMLISYYGENNYVPNDGVEFEIGEDGLFLSAPMSNSVKETTNK